MARAHIRLTDEQIMEVKAQKKMLEMPTRSAEMEKVLTGRHADPNLLTVDEYWLVEKFLVKVE